MHILSELYFCLAEYAVRTEENEREYKQQSRQPVDAADCFLHTLTENQRNDFLELECLRNAIASIDDETMFCHGFKIGANLMLSILRSDSKY